MITKIPRKLQAERCVAMAGEFIRDGRHKEAVRNLKVAATLLEMDLTGFDTVKRIEGKR